MTDNVNETIVEAIQRTSLEQAARDTAILAALNAILAELKKGKK